MIDIIKTSKFRNAVLLFLTGIILMLLPDISFTPKAVSSGEKAFPDGIEQSLSEALRETYNLEYAKVIITYDTYGEKVVEYNYEQTVSDTENTYQKSSVADKSSNQPFVKTEKLPYVRGALVSVSAADENTCFEIRSAVSTLLGVSVNKVNVISGKE
ncbi:MAG: hypothetical protein IJ460_00515 [Clostridia bacterium]|nr:hypothetical protein [Clostridia bacterium]